MFIKAIFIVFQNQHQDRVSGFFLNIYQGFSYLITKAIPDSQIELFVASTFE